MENRLIIQKTMRAHILPKKPFESTDSMAIKGAERTTLSFETNSMSPITSPIAMGAWILFLNL